MKIGSKLVTGLSVSDSEITGTVPPGAVTATVSVTTPGGTALSPTNWTRIAIKSFTPTSGQDTTLVTITGSGFTGATAVDFNAVPGFSLQVLSDTKLTVQVPCLSPTGNYTVSVVTPNGTATAAVQFNNAVNCT